VGRTGKPVAEGRLDPAALRVGIPAAAVLAVALSVPFGPLATAAHLTALASAWAYDLGVKSSPLSVLSYAVSFGLLPAFVVLGLPDRPLPPGWLVAAAALLGCAAHFVNTLPDLADDAAVGVHGLPHRLGAAWSRVLAAALVLTAAALLVLGPPGALSTARLLSLPAAVLILGTGLLIGRRPGSRAAFNSVLVVAVLTVLGYFGARSRDLFVGESLLFLVAYLFLGKWVRDALYYGIATTVRRGEPVEALLIHAPVDALYAAGAGLAAILVYRALRR
jgi:4-hydroxybenzoate polyprenyltransferase